MNFLDSGFRRDDDFILNQSFPKSKRWICGQQMSRHAVAHDGRYTAHRRGLPGYFSRAIQPRSADFGYGKFVGKMRICSAIAVRRFSYRTPTLMRPLPPPTVQFEGVCLDNSIAAASRLISSTRPKTDSTIPIILTPNGVSSTRPGVCEKIFTRSSSSSSVIAVDRVFCDTPLIRADSPIEPELATSFTYCSCVNLTAWSFHALIISIRLPTRHRDGGCVVSWRTQCNQNDGNKPINL
jgi:hypothetical protein